VSVDKRWDLITAAYGRISSFALVLTPGQSKRSCHIVSQGMLPGAAEPGPGGQVSEPRGVLCRKPVVVIF
jgi:hypothetical protein